MAAPEARTHYEALQVAPNASRWEMKAAYQRLVLTHHPDKAGGGDAAAFQAVQAAWSVLREDKARSDYDKQLAYETLAAQVGVADTLDLDDMEENEELEAFSADCRCGGSIEVTYQQLEEGEDVVQCAGCSLLVQILYEAQ